MVWLLFPSAPFYSLEKEMEPKLKTYIFTVRYRDFNSLEWEFKNVIIRHDVSILFATKKMKDRFTTNQTVIIDNIFSEEEVI